MNAPRRGGRSARATSAYELQGNLDGQRFQDVYAVDTKTGQKKVVKKKLRWGNGASPDGTKYLYYENQHFHVFDVETGTARNITMGVPASFIDIEDDHNVVDPPTSALGWTSDNAYVLISDRWDIWKVPVAAGQPAVNLTVNGKKDKIRYQSARAHRSARSAAPTCRSAQYLLGDGRVDEEVRLRRARARHDRPEDAAVGRRGDRRPAEGGEGRRVDLPPRDADGGAGDLRDRRVARQRPEDRGHVGRSRRSTCGRRARSC